MASFKWLWLNCLGIAVFKNIKIESLEILQTDSALIELLGEDF
jgi:hypothetical protein